MTRCLPMPALQAWCIPFALRNFPFTLAMSKKSKSNPASLADPSQLKSFADDLLQVIIETPKGCRNKYAYDHEQGIFALRKVLPEGMVFPHDFGFLPQTLAEDGDPIDVLLLMDVPAFSGCLIPARLIGVMEGEQIEDSKGDKKGGKNGSKNKAVKKTRNDRLIAIAQATHTFANIQKLTDLPEQFRTELEAFFVNYHGLEGKKYNLLGYKAADTAMGLVKKAQKAAARAK
jgi:inorganic pyrophosphatase